MNKFWSAAALSAFAGITIANAQTVIYAPERSIADQRIALRGWGSGTIAQTDELAYEGTNSIRVSSRNFFQGGIMTFGTPLDLSKLFGDKNNMLRITLQAPDSKTTMGGPGNGGGGLANSAAGPGSAGAAGAGAAGAAGAGAAGAGAPGRGGQRGGLAGQGPGNGSPGGGTSATSTQQPPLSRIRMIVTTSDGMKSEAYVDISTSGKGERGWKQVSIPLESITGFGRTNKMVKELAFAGDSVSTFYVGDMRVINDTTPITGEARIDRTNMALGDEATLTAYGYGGSSVLKYQWDFDSDGQVDTEGAYVKHKFRKPGDFTITLTVTDVFGLKTPYKTQLKIHVNP